jgi:hypothetical protein
LVTIEESDLKVPQAWLDIDEDFGIRLAENLNGLLAGGLASEHLEKLGIVLTAMWRLVDNWLGSDRPTKSLADEAQLQTEVRSALEMAGLQISEGGKGGGGAFDLFLENTILLENKIEGRIKAPEGAKPAAGMQGRRYAIALDAQIVLVVLAYQPEPGKLLDKSSSVIVRQIEPGRKGRAEIRFMLPYGAVVPSREKPMAGPD